MAELGTPSPAPAITNHSEMSGLLFLTEENWDSKRNERAEQWRRQNRTDAILVNVAAVEGEHTRCATVTASPAPAITDHSEMSGFLFLTEAY